MGFELTDLGTKIEKIIRYETTFFRFVADYLDVFGSKSHPKTGACNGEIGNLIAPPDETFVVFCYNRKGFGC